MNWLPRGSGLRRHSYVNRVSAGLTVATLLVAIGCGNAGIPAPTAPQQPTARLIEPPPCVTQPPPEPGPILLAIPSATTELTKEQDAALWAYVDGLEQWSSATWTNCKPKDE